MDKKRRLINVAIFGGFFLMIVLGVLIWRYNTPSKEHIQKSFDGVMVRESGEVVPCELKIEGNYTHWYFNAEPDSFQFFNVNDNRPNGFYINGERYVDVMSVVFIDKDSDFSILCGFTDGRGNVIANSTLDSFIVDGLCYDFENGKSADRETGERCLLVAPATDKQTAAEQLEKFIDAEPELYSLWMYQEGLTSELWQICLN